MSALAKRYMARIHELQCAVHQHCHSEYRPADEAHHIEFVRGDHSDFAVVPLCAECHTLLHQMRREPFYRLYNLTDVKLLAWTARAMFAAMESDRG